MFSKKVMDIALVKKINQFIFCNRLLTYRALLSRDKILYYFATC